MLLVDGDALWRQKLSDYLGDNEIEVIALENASGIAEVMERRLIDLLVVDVHVSGQGGVQIARRLREQSAIPIILLSARSDEADRVMGLELGADDYVIKPFSPRELLARIRALLRRSQRVAEGLRKVRAYRFAGWQLNVRLRHLTSPDGEGMSLTNAEFNLLTVFLAAPQRVLSRTQLLDLSRMHNDEVYERAIDVQVMRLRRKIRSNGDQPPIIRTAHGAGYLFTAEVQPVR
ncbi:MAG TPA: response regulator [Burkholderiales bacterium]|nr:response regulator [Burkholderiales bacterium]